MPLEAKNKKGLIFGDKYDDIFSDETTAAKILLPYSLFELIEKEKEQRAKGKSAWLRYASYHILHAMCLLAIARKISVEFSNLEKISKLYDRARRAVGAARNTARKEAKRKKREYTDVLFFKSRASKRNLERVLGA